MTYVSFPLFTPAVSMPGTKVPMPHHHRSQFRFSVVPYLRSMLGTVDLTPDIEGVECLVAWNKGMVDPSIVRLPVVGQAFEVDPTTGHTITRSIEWQAAHIEALYRVYAVGPEDRAALLPHEIERQAIIDERAAAAPGRR